MDLVAGLRMKGARERAWLVGDPAWMRRWLLERANAGQGSSLELKSRFGAKCLELAAAHAPDLVRKALPTSQRDLDGGNSAIPHWVFEPRIPAGNGVESGRWTTLAGDVPKPAGGAQGQASDAAANTAGIGHNQGPPLDEKPEIPRSRPAKSEDRTRIAKSVANAARPKGKFAILVMIAAAGAKWLVRQIPSIISYLDPPKTLEELQANVFDDSWPGYHDHHIEEEEAAKKSGVPTSDINARENLARIPKYKHYQITGWYQTANERYGGLTPREYLSDKPREVRREVGLFALRHFGVLAP